VNLKTSMPLAFISQSDYAGVTCYCGDAGAHARALCVPHFAYNDVHSAPDTHVEQALLSCIHTHAICAPFEFVLFIIWARSTVQ